MTGQHRSVTGASVRLRGTVLSQLPAEHLLGLAGPRGALQWRFGALNERADLGVAQV